MSFTRLDSHTNKDGKVAELFDADPLAGGFWFLLLAAGGIWGRFPADPRLLRARVCPLMDCFTSDVVEGIVRRLEDLQMVVRYMCEWTGEETIACANWSKYNHSGRQYHRMGRPEFSPPPHWQPPRDLIEYLTKVKVGEFKSKTFTEECAKFGVPDDIELPVKVDQKSLGSSPQGAVPREQSHGSSCENSQGAVPKEHSQGAVPKEHSQGAVPKEHSQGAVPKEHSFESTPHTVDGDGDGETTNDDDVSCAREARSGEPAAASALVGVASRGGGDGDGHSERHVPSRAAWIAMHGPPPQDQYTDHAVYYAMARNAYLAGEKGPMHGFDFPGQEVTTSAASAGATE